MRKIKILILFIFLSNAFSLNYDTHLFLFITKELMRYYYKNEFLTKYNLYPRREKRAFIAGNISVLSGGLYIITDSNKFLNHLTFRVRAMTSVDNKYSKEKIIYSIFDSNYNSIFPGDNEKYYGSILRTCIHEALKFNAQYISFEFGYSAFYPNSRIFQLRFDVMPFIGLSVINRVKIDKESFSLKMEIVEENAPQPVEYKGERAFSILTNNCSDTLDTLYRPLGYSLGLRLYFSIVLFELFVLTVGYNLPLKFSRIEGYFNVDWLSPDLFDNYNIFIAAGIGMNKYIE